MRYRNPEEDWEELILNDMEYITAVAVANILTDPEVMEIAKKAYVEELMNAMNEYEYEDFTKVASKLLRTFDSRKVKEAFREQLASLGEHITAGL